MTRRSVVWADRTVATSSWKGFSKSSSGWAYGYTSASSRLIRRARRTRAVRDSLPGGATATFLAGTAFFTGTDPSAATAFSAGVTFRPETDFPAGATFRAEADFPAGVTFRAEADFLAGAAFFAEGAFAADAAFPADPAFPAEPVSSAMSAFFLLFLLPPGPCSPTAESRRTTTR
ncbi:hypothetical protein GPN2_10077 [Streptomyces murinus]